MSRRCLRRTGKSAHWDGQNRVLCGSAAANKHRLIEASQPWLPARDLHFVHAHGRPPIGSGDGAESANHAVRARLPQSSGRQLSAAHSVLESTLPGAATALSDTFVQCKIKRTVSSSLLISERHFILRNSRLYKDSSDFRIFL